MKPEIPDTLPDHWAEFFQWAVACADRESEGAPETELINEQGESL